MVWCRGELSILAGAWVFGLAGVFVKYLDLAPTVLAGFRLMVPGLILFILAGRLRKSVLTNHDGPMLLASFLTVFRILLWVMGLLWAPISKAVIILFSWPIIFYVMSVVSGREVISLRHSLLLCLALLGLVLVGGDQTWDITSQESIGLLCMLGSAFLFATNMFIFKATLNKSSPFEVVLRDSLVGTVIFAPFVFAHALDYSVGQVVGGIGYGVTIGLIGYGFMYYGLARVKASTAAVLCYGEVLSACLLGVWLFDETLNTVEIVGALCILSAAFWVRESSTSSDTKIE